MLSRLKILCAVMVALVAGVLFSYRDSGQTLSKSEGELLFPKLQRELNSISRIEIAQGRVKSTIHKDKEGVWRVKEKADYPANLVMVRGLISAFARSYYLEEKSAKEENYKHFGLDENHARTVSLYTNSETHEAALLVGLQKASRDGTFVRWPDKPRTWLAKYNLAYNVAPQEWIERELFSIPAPAIKSITLIKPGASEVHVYRESENGALRLENIPEGKTVKDPVQFTGILAMFEPLSIEDVRRSSELMSSSAEELRVETFDGRGVTLRFNKDRNDVWVTVQTHYIGIPAISQKDDKSQVWVKNLADRTNRFAFKISPILYEKLNINMNDLTK